jgi:hypothetical protein
MRSAGKASLVSAGTRVHRQEPQRGRTALSDLQYKSALKIALRCVDAGSRLTNTTLRKATGLNYDQAIKLFSRAVIDGTLRRWGKAAGTSYRRRTEGEE